MISSVSKSTPIVVAFGLVAGIAVCRLWPETRQPSAQSVCTGLSEPMQRVELAFGLSTKGRDTIGETEWAAFLDREVTPRFPDGLTVLSGQGQWRNSSGHIIKEPARVLLVWVRPAGDLEARIDAVRAAWMAEFFQESVLKAVGTSCVGF